MHDAVSARQLYNFALQHLLTTARCARACHRIEQENEGKPFGPFFEEVQSSVTAGVLSAVASMEANLNELLVGNPGFGSSLTNRAFDEIWRDAERRSLLDKYQFVLMLLDQDEIPRGEPIFQNADALVRMRNALVHFRPEWDDEQGIHHTVGERLRNRFKPSQFTKEDDPLFPRRCMCRSCLDWALTTSREFMRDFSERSGLPFKFDGNQDFSTK